MAEGTTSWLGLSGQAYKYWIYSMGTTFKDSPGNYIFAKKFSSGRWMPIYIGETESLQDRLSDHEKLPCIKRHGGTHIHVHTAATNQETRRVEELDLLANLDPPCNKE